MTNKYLHTEDIKNVLKDKADFVQQDGLNYLIPTWQRFANEYADTEDLIYEWLNDLDTRKIIDEILITLTDTDKLKIQKDLQEIDNLVIKKTFEINECVWGDINEKTHGYNRNKNWYYYRMNQEVFDNEAGKFSKRQ